MSKVSGPLYDDLNNTSNFGTKLSQGIKFEGKYEGALVCCFLKNTDDVPRKDCTQDIKVRRHN